MRLSDIVGHDRQIEVLRRALASGRVPHACLFAGPDGIGKESVALGLAAALVCRDDAARATGDACGRCNSCHRFGTSGAHPDVLRVMSHETMLARKLATRDELGDDARTPSRDIRIEQAREIVRWLALKPYEAQAKVGIIAEADRLNAPSQNALLKTLEEPPPRTVIMLVTDRPHALLPTVRSRCAWFGFTPVPIDAATKVLVERHGIAPAEASIAARLGSGSIGDALEIAKGEIVTARDGVIADLTALDGATWSETLERAEGWAAGKGAGLRDRLAVAETFLRDVVVAGEGAPDDELVHADRADVVRDAAAAAPRGAALARLDAVRAAARSIDRNANTRLAVEALFVRWKTAAFQSGQGAGAGSGDRSNGGAGAEG